MTKIVMLQQMSGSRNGKPWPAVGETAEVSEDEAVALCGGQTPVARRDEPEAKTEQAEEERAVAPEPEVAEEQATAKRAPASRPRSTANKK